MPMPAVTFTYHLAIQHYPTYSVPQTGWWCRCACNRASSYRTGLSSTAAPAASDLTLEVGSFHPHTAAAPCRASSYTTPPQRSASRNFASRDSLKVRLRCGLILCSCHKRFTVFLLTPCVAAMSWQLHSARPRRPCWWGTKRRGIRSWTEPLLPSAVFWEKKDRVTSHLFPLI